MSRFIEHAAKHDMFKDYEESIVYASASFRGIRHKEVVQLGDIASEIRGKVVGDIGSGLGGLAKTAHYEGIETTIWSVNPQLADDYYYNWQNSVPSMRLEMQEHYPGITDDEIRAAIDCHNRHMSTNFAHDLHDFPDGFFDTLVDIWAVHAYFPQDDQLFYDTTIDEMLRVTKPGGEIIVGHSGRRELWEENGLGKTALAKRNIPFAPIYASVFDRNTMVGVRIHKSVENAD